MKISAAAKTDTGLVRQNNEDHYHADVDLGLFVVADGMGGHASGEVASKMAVDIIRDSVKGADSGRPLQLGVYRSDCSETTNRLGSSIRLANMAIYEASGKNAQLQGMGTTVAAARVDGSRLSIAHVGDSRIYLIRAGNIEQLTDDHSIVSEQVKRELITREEAAQSEMKNILTRALGVRAEVEVDMDEISLAPNDILLLCSDGLTGMVNDETLLSEVTATDDPAEACEQLIRLANRNGGRDNITVVVVHLDNKKGFFPLISDIFKWLWR